MKTKPTIEKSTELIPPEGDPEVGHAVFQLLADIIEDKEGHGYIDKWNRAAELTRNKHWKQKSGKSGLVTANLLFAHRQRTVNMLTDNNPTFNVSQMGSDAEEDFADKILKLSEFWWGDQEQQGVFEKSVGNGEEMGACVEKIIFNPDLEMGGEVEVLNVPLFNVGFYPVNITDYKKAEAVLHYYPMSVREARRKWPEFADQIAPDEDILKEVGDNRREISSGANDKGSSYLSTFLSAVKNIINNAGGATEGSDEVLIVEAWVKDFTQAPIGEPQQDPQTGETVQMYGPRYKGNIRMIQTCNAGQIVLADQDNPSINPNIPDEQAVNCYLYDKFPFVLAQSITDTVSVWGLSDYEQLEQLNIEVDKTISQLTLMKDKASRLKIINPKTSGVPNDHFTNRPGVLNPANAMEAAGIRYMEGPRIPAELVQFMEIYKDLFFTVAGSFDLEQANTQGRDVIAYKAIAALIERASTFLKGKIRNYSRLIRERGRMFISLAQNWYTEERWITFEENGETEAMPIVGTDLLFPAKISVVSGSTMPRSRVQEREEAIALFQMGAIDQEELFKRLDWPNRKTLLERMRQGPLAAMFQRLQLMGIPPQIVQMVAEIAKLDDKEFERMAKSGDIPNLMQMLQAMLSGKQPPDFAAMKEQAEVGEIQSEIMLNQEKTRTERVKQITAMAGIEFDAESLKQNWAKIMAAIEDQRDNTAIKGVDAGLKMAQTIGQFNERGMKSNNKEIIR